MDIFEIRRRKLIELKDKFCDGKIVILAEKIGKEQSYVSKLLFEPGKKWKKNISDKLVEDIEKSFSLTRGWLDGLAASNESKRVLTKRELALLDLFESMPESDKTEIMQRLAEKKEHYEALLEELLEVQRKAG